MGHVMLDSRLAWLGDGPRVDLIRDGLRGIEKECLRVDARGRLSRRPHPAALGAALTHPYITTDYSEALFEFVTPPYATNAELLQFLCDIHCFVNQHIGDERLWPQSMPCVVRPDEDVPIADYGESNLGRLKTIYRRGLGHRYGRAMQAIAGVHFNYSLPTSFWPAYQEHCRDSRSAMAFRSDHYLKLARNFRRHAWLLIYLFGASPAVCKSFPLRSGHNLESFDSGTWYLPYGTSLRMSDIGYRNKSQAGLKISLNSLDEYVEGLATAVSTPHPDYARIGIRVDGEYQQLNANVLQIENEYYTAIRPKPAPGSAPRVVPALRRDGIHYVEVRTLDLSVANPLGVNPTQLRFIEALLLYCLFDDSPALTARELEEIDARELLVAREGRRPGVEIPVDGRRVPLARQGALLMERVRTVAALLDSRDDDYAAAVDAQQPLFESPELTPSARMLAEMSERGQGFLDYTLGVANAHHTYFESLTLPDEQRTALQTLARRSVDEAQELEHANTSTFDEYLAAYTAEILG
jgi:glutamate--cysteine ligase